MGAPGPDPELPCYDLLGVRVSAIDMDMAVAAIESWIVSAATTRRGRYICVTGVHGLMESRRSPRLRDIHNRADMVTPDGMPLVWLGRHAGRRHMDRVYGPDLVLELCRRSPARGHRHYFYGGAPGVADLLAERLGRRFPGLAVVGTGAPPFRPLDRAERRAVALAIDASGADIVWIGLSTPKQELLMAELAPLLDRAILIGVGAAFDFHAGLKVQAPRWLRRSGLEWAFRLAMEPRRLWRRYLVNNSMFVALLVREAMRAPGMRGGPGSVRPG